LCTNGGHHGGRHLASVTRYKSAKAVVEPFIKFLINNAN